MKDLPHDKTAEIVEKMMKDRFVSRIAANTAASLAEKMVESDPETARALAIGITKGPNFNSVVRGRAKAVLGQLGEQ